MRLTIRGGQAAVGTSRLVYGVAGERRHGPKRIAAEIAAAGAIDGLLGMAGLARPILFVSGFWRSGTTWLQESLARSLDAKSIFEPLSPLEPRRRAEMERDRPGDTEDLRQATIPGPAPVGSPFWSSLDRAATGRASSAYLMSCREGVGDSCRRRIVVKDVRLQANLAGLHGQTGIPVAHIRRHPGAVVASLVAADWHWSFARAPLATLLPRLGDALPEAEREKALRFDTDTVSRIAAFWAVTERIAARQLQGQPWGALVSYETFASAPGPTLAGLCHALHLKPRRSVDFAVPSASVDPERFAAYGASPRDRWRQLLGPGEIDKIEAAVRTLFPEWRDTAAASFDTEPVCP